MNDPVNDPIPISPIRPVQLHAADRFQFRCHKGIACFNRCCENVDILLTPWDIARMARHFGLDTRDVIDRYTVDFQMDGQGMPGLKLARREDSTACINLTPEGCGIYADRPSACRYYALGAVSLRKKDASDVEDSYFVVKEPHCLGHDEPVTQTIAEYRASQGVDEYDDANHDWREIVLRWRSTGPAVGKPPLRSFELFFLASYDLDGFRRFVASAQFSATFDVPRAQLEVVAREDRAALRFAMGFLRQALFGERTIAVRAGVAEQRLPAYRQRLARDATDKAARLADEQDAQYDAIRDRP